ncbi:hypothetical protein ABZS29_17795 [Kribbella sp. NPDC005582]|uniref:hypothetical protein n=1 Tax=Kribbella sp. NPDC005582 TaxID=3156893 RepID=UPI00339E84B9
MTTSAISRRSVLGGLAAAAVAGTTGLTACSPSNGSAGGGTIKAVPLPTYVPHQGAKPDLPAGENGVRAGYLKYPLDSLVKTVDEVPGAGGTIRYQTFNFGASPTQRERNLYWQDMERRVGVKWEYYGVPGDNYLAKVQTTIAGGDLPECMTFGSPYFAVPQLPQLLDSKFTDLSDYLSGDNVKKYPNLAGLSTSAWKGAVYNGRIYGLPRQAATISGIWFVHADKFAAAGFPDNPKNPDELFEALKAANSPKNGTWAITNPSTALQMARVVVGAGQDWTVADGKFTSVYETEAYIKALEYAAKANAAGLLNPDGPTADGNVLFTSGKALLAIGSTPAWGVNYDTLKQQGGKLGAWVGYKADGTLAPVAAAPAHSFFTAIKKGLSKERIEEILRVANYTAAPFGSEEEFAISFGVKGIHHTVTGGTPVQTPKYKQDAPLGFNYLAAAPVPIINTVNPDQVQLTHDYESLVAKAVVTEPTTGLYSTTEGTQGAVLRKLAGDFANDIVLGRKKPADWTRTGLPQWKARGGDKLATEYAEAAAGS